MREGRAPRGSARQRTLALVALEVGALGVATWLGLPSAGSAVPELPAAGVAALFAASSLLVFHLDVRDEAHSFTFAEVALVLALFLASPSDLLVGRLLGEAVALVFHPGQPLVKVLVNLATAAVECTVALVVFVAVLGAPGVATPMGWVAAAAAVLGADVVGTVLIGAVVRWHGGAAPTRHLATVATGSAVANTCVGVIAALLLHVHVAAVVLLGGVVGVLHAAYRGYAQLAERHASLEVLHGFTEALGGAVHAEDVTSAMLHHARALLRADVAELVVLDPDGSDVRLRLEDARPRLLPLEPAARSGLLELAAGEVALHARARPVGALAAYAASLGRDDSVVVALDLPDARAVLSIAGRRAEVSTFDDDDARLLATLGRHATLAMVKHQLIDGLQADVRRREHEGRHDQLTGLLNRAHFQDLCAEALLADDAGAGCAVLVLDLDAFSEVNDAFGHEVGDAALAEVGRRLEALFDGDGVVARVGGDEFGVLLRSPAGLEGATAAATRAIDGLRRPILVGGLELDVRASVGIACPPAEGAADLLQHAASAAQEAKQGASTVAVHREGSTSGSPERVRLAAELRRAMAADELRTHFQPKADLRTGEIIGAEALARWPHATRGQVPPAVFVPLAQQTGLASALTAVVLRRALAACARWRSTGHELGIAVNVASRSLLDPTFTAEVEALLCRAELPPAALVLELSEAALIADGRRGVAALEHLAALGVQLSVDDVGTGWSTLSALEHLPVHELKVDRSVTARVCEDGAARTTVRAIVELGHGLGLRVVAEGVEDQRAWDELLDLGCDVGQGYVLSRPLPEDDLLAWMERRGARGRAALLAGSGRRAEVPSRARVSPPPAPAVRAAHAPAAR